MERQFLLTISMPDENETEIAKKIDAELNDFAEAIGCPVTLEEISEIVDMSPLEKLASLNETEDNLLSTKIKSSEFILRL
ncbi:hypothetical protein [Lysinibacillus boronitolerans]|uniref:hypothetical protein n=1 Tax=Lysinibacillus boronitolerans TaxID=309788 RepID=UPI0002FEA5D6|nr:hypothetical protein [Lysinibacillus boronitolerans]